MENVFFSNWESIGRTFSVGVLAYVSLMLVLRISGKRTLSQMREFDFIVTVALGSTLASVLLTKEISLMDGVVAMGILIGLQYILAYVSVRSKTFSKLISSEPTLIFYKGNFLWSALRKERVTEAEVRSILRNNGIVSIEGVEAVVMESNGQFTVVKEGNLTSEDSPLSGVKRID